MKRLFTIASIAFLSLAVLVSCNKESFQETDILKPQTEKITISASIADMATKTNYEDVDGMLKTTWSANDSISVLTIETHDEGYQILLAVDNFHSTCAEGSDMADFTGTLTDVTGNNIMRICHYPALIHVRECEGEDIEDNYYNYYPGSDSNVLESFGIENSLFNRETFYLTSQLGMDLKEYLKKADIMTGLLSGDATSGYSVSLKKQTYVLKLELDLSDIAGSTIDELILKFDSEPFSDNRYSLSIDSEGNYIYTMDGSRVANSDIYFLESITIPEDGKVALYVTSSFEFAVNQGDNITIEAVQWGDWDDLVLASVSKTLKSDLVFEKGNFYTLKATLVSPTSGSEPEMVDLGLSVKWASFNLGASSPEGYGLYYQWGDTQGYGPGTSDGKYFDWQDESGNISYKWCNGTMFSITKYCTRSTAGTVDNKTVLEAEDDAANVALGGSWRIPTEDEWNELINNENCTWTWTTLNYVNGYKVQSRKEGYTDNWIFLPAAGYGVQDILEIKGSGGSYWSSSLTTDFPMWGVALDFDSDNVGVSEYFNRCYGNSIRPVTE